MSRTYLHKQFRTDPTQVRHQDRWYTAHWCPEIAQMFSYNAVSNTSI